MICSRPVRDGAHPRPMGFSRTGKANGAPGRPGGVDDEPDGPDTNTRPAPEPRGRGVGARGDDGLRGRDRPGHPRRPPPRRGLLPRAPPDRLPRDQGALRAQRAGRRAHRRRATSPSRASSTRPAARTPSPSSPRTVPAPGNARHYAQIVKQNALLRRLLERLAADPAVGPRARGRARASSSSRPRALLFKVAHEERASDFRQRRRGPRRGDRPPRGAGQGRPRGHRARRPASATSTTCSAASSPAT